MTARAIQEVLVSERNCRTEKNAESQNQNSVGNLPSLSEKQYDREGRYYVRADDVPATKARETHLGKLDHRIGRD